MTQAGSADGWIVDRYSIPDSSGRNYGFFYELENVVWRLVDGKYRIIKKIYETIEDEIHTHYLAVEFEIR